MTMGTTSSADRPPVALPKVLSGANQIGRALGCSAATVLRLHQRGLLPTFKIGPATSPIKMTRTAALAIIRGRLEEAVDLSGNRSHG
jgi:hypothetical protein